MLIKKCYIISSAERVLSALRNFNYQPRPKVSVNLQLRMSWGKEAGAAAVSKDMATDYLFVYFKLLIDVV